MAAGLPPPFRDAAAALRASPRRDLWILPSSLRPSPLVLLTRRSCLLRVLLFASVHRPRLPLSHPVPWESQVRQLRVICLVSLRMALLKFSEEPETAVKVNS